LPLHPQIEPILAAEAAVPAPASVEEAREQYDATALRFAGEPEEVARVEDVPGIGRLYVPDDAAGAVLWIHGGGWVLGTVDGYDPLCRALANRCGAAVLSVDYRLAPETPFPGPLEDCERALAWLAERFPGPLAVAGDSAGGNLATVLARRARDADGPELRFQLLVYPVTDAACATGSMLEFGGGDYRLTRDGMKAFWDLYAPGASQRSPDASPLRAASLEGMPPALVILAEYDPLTDEGSDYAERLPDARVSVYPGMVHGFFRWRGAVDAAHEAMDEAAAALRAALRA
jgi:acetyl esterase